MKKIVIIGANNFQMPLIKKAKQLGYETHVFAWADGAVEAEFAASEAQADSIEEIVEVVEGDNA